MAGINANEYITKINDVAKLFAHFLITSSKMQYDKDKMHLKHTQPNEMRDIGRYCERCA